VITMIGAVAIMLLRRTGTEVSPDA
jgi:hypothetical protein